MSATMEAMNMLSSLTSSFSRMSCNGRELERGFGRSCFWVSQGTDLKTASGAILADDADIWRIRAGAYKGTYVIVPGIS